MSFFSSWVNPSTSKACYYHKTNNKQPPYGLSCQKSCRHDFIRRLISRKTSIKAIASYPRDQTSRGKPTYTWKPKRPPIHKYDNLPKTLLARPGIVIIHENARWLLEEAHKDDTGSNETEAKKRTCSSMISSFPENNRNERPTRMNRATDATSREHYGWANCCATFPSETSGLKLVNAQNWRQAKFAVEAAGGGCSYCSNTKWRKGSSKAKAIFVATSLELRVRLPGEKNRVLQNWQNRRGRMKNRGRRGNGKGGSTIL